MKKNNRFPFMMLALWGLGSLAWSGSIRGSVVDEKSVGIEGMVVRIEGEQWEGYAVTEADGTFQVDDLPPGWYHGWVERAQGQVIGFPPCGRYDDYLEESGELWWYFLIRRPPAGVAVDFGTPNGIGPVTVNANGQFDLEVSATNLPIYGSVDSDVCIIEGRWYAPRGGFLDIGAISGWSASGYTSMSLTRVNSPVGRFRLEMRLGSEVFGNGKMATFTFQLTHQAWQELYDADGEFCLCIEEAHFLTEDGAVPAEWSAWCDAVSFKTGGPPPQ